jgi:hypothetical protein
MSRNFKWQRGGPFVLTGEVKFWILCIDRILHDGGEALRENAWYRAAFWSCGVLLLALAGCESGPHTDITVRNGALTWKDAREASAEVVNRGNAAAGEFPVSFTLRQCPAPPEPVTVTRTLDGLAPGGSVNLSADFAPLARQENANLARANAVVVTADPGDLIPEGKEGNNEAVIPFYDISGLPMYKYGKALPSVLRGIVIDAGDAPHLGLPRGYYRIREFRRWWRPGDRAIALSLEKDYSTGWRGLHPQRNEEWVFSIIDQYDYDENEFRFQGRDLFGHTLRFSIRFESGCSRVLIAVLDCRDVEVSAQSPETGELNTCGWGREPAWASLPE